MGFDELFIFYFLKNKFKNFLNLFFFEPKKKTLSTKLLMRES